MVLGGALPPFSIYMQSQTISGAMQKSRGRGFHWEWGHEWGQAHASVVTLSLWPLYTGSLSQNVSNAPASAGQKPRIPPKRNQDRGD